MYFFVPETKGRTLEEMDEIFGSQGMASADAERKHRIEREIGLLALVGAEAPEFEKDVHSEKFVENKAEAHTETITAR